MPMVDLYEAEGYLVFKIDLPGIDLEDVVIKVYDDMLVIEGKRKEEREEKRLNYICMERNLEGFRRILQIPVPVVRSEGKAVYADGVITLSFPKAGDRGTKIAIEKK